MVHRGAVTLLKEKSLHLSTLIRCKGCQQDDGSFQKKNFQMTNGSIAIINMAALETNFLIESFLKKSK
jgi:hypothetical protein